MPRKYESSAKSKNIAGGRDLETQLPLERPLGGQVNTGEEKRAKIFVIVGFYKAYKAQFFVLTIFRCQLQ